MDEKLKEAHDRLAVLEKREAALKAAEARPRRKSNEIRFDQDLFDAITKTKDAIEKGVREIRNLVTGKNRPEQAFQRWITRFCEPNI